MAAVGYDIYTRLMREAVEEIKGIRPERNYETSVEININAYIPADYIDDEIQRIEIYKKIAAVDGLARAKQVREEITDRYGTIPKTVENLILILLIKSFASKAGIISVTRNGSVFTLKYGENNHIDVKKLLSLLEQYENIAQLRSALPPYIVFEAKGHTIDALLRFLRDIRRCIIQ
jgi:transcription-repair coupling factor (superfamily II helicase)